MQCKTFSHYDNDGKRVDEDKKTYLTQDEAISIAKKINLTNSKLEVSFITKAVAYKCKVCGKFHIGRNGKELTAKYINQIMYILGDYGLKVNVDTILESKSQKSGNAASGDVARLKGARLVIASEPEFGAELKEGLIKDLTGREKITARHLYEDEITFEPTFKIVLVTNHRVNIKSQDKGIWRRVKETPFLITIPDEKIDRDLDVKLKAESPGILNWMLEGCKKWQESGMQVPKDVIEATQSYKEDMDVLGEFLKLCCVDDKKAVTPNRWLYNQVYLAYCEVMGIRAWSQKTFSSSLQDRGNGYKIVHTRNGNAWKNLGLNLHLSQYLSQLEVDTAGGAVRDVRDVTRFMKTFLCTPACNNFMENISHPSHPSQKEPIDNGNSTVKDSSTVKDDISPPKIILEQNFQKLQSKNTVESEPERLRRILEEGKIRFEKENGCLNSANINIFCLKIGKWYDLSIPENTHNLKYELSQIGAFATKTFGLTPEAR